MQDPLSLLKSLAPCLCGLLLVGCLSAGKDFNVHMVPQIELHQTTREQIEQMFGPPWRTGVEDGRPTWSYGTYKTGIGDTLSRDLVIRFDVNNTVASYTFNSNFPEDRQL
ncbi:MAG: hypothetical protein PHI97_15225 [Desulfobulbus sp.]|nr:hypothetical protein [Desulfobulbus sp.]